MTSNAPASRRILVDLENASAYTRGILRGVLAYAAAHSDWQIQLGRNAGYLAKWIGKPTNQQGTSSQAPDGAIELICEPTPGDDPPTYPRVNVSDRSDDWPGPRVTVDNPAVGRLAAEHLIEQGCEHFAFVGPMRWRLARRRYEGFAERVAEAGGEVQLSPELGSAHETALAPPDWLAALPHPVGILCFTDRCGYGTIHAAQAAGLSVPDDVAVIGVDNDELVYRAVRPELSSVALPLEEIGRRAGALLDSLLRGESPPAEPIELPPIGMEGRDSSRFRGVDDPLVRRVAGFMREHLHEGIDMAAVVRHSGVSRRTLEYRFREAMGCTPHAELTRLRCQRAGELLRTTGLSLGRIAERCGYASQSYFSKAFTKQTGHRPGAYRQQFTG